MKHLYLWLRHLVAKRLLFLLRRFFSGIIGDGVARFISTRNQQIDKKTTHLLIAEYDAEKDYMHQRRSALNQVICRALLERKGEVFFSYSLLQRHTGKELAFVLGRLRQDVRLCEKYGVPYSFVSFARDGVELRGAKDIAALKRFLRRKL